MNSSVPHSPSTCPTGAADDASPTAGDIARDGPLPVPNASIPVEQDTRMQGVATAPAAHWPAAERSLPPLLHVGYCREAVCSEPRCGKMKRLVSHIKTCTHKPRTQCPLCRPLVTLCCYHAKQCNDGQCLVPFCQVIRAGWEKPRTRQQEVVKLHGQVLPPSAEGVPARSAPRATSSPLDNHPQFVPHQVAVKKWHQVVVDRDEQASTDSLRKHLIEKLVEAIFPYKDRWAALEKRMTNIVSYAHKVEANMYEQANSREEYYEHLAEKIYKIKTVMEDQRRQRREQLRVHSGQVGLQAGVPFPGNAGQMRMGRSGADGMAPPGTQLQLYIALHSCAAVHLMQEHSELILLAEIFLWAAELFQWLFPYG
ncbi:histone lysine acetyltransferase CREBBP-like [Paramacrobiotus metropolitanus]|uniref:histone lysine acetyltransferase CREBBP-like n=1 Tax=Paramacrobiotus metropolitanus TaxID=2943436 RepID=UPI0024459641|nr:histone lysine acetyltransferase CREBBP-like [Paramacrobiotus metropolitanus]XP_055355034.1 histone lysine acetyltransferase CREBBP-like [Paramacrobiotus metropolitanus]